MYISGGIHETISSNLMNALHAFPNSDTKSKSLLKASSANLSAINMPAQEQPSNIIAS
jgi:hypothetical protein